MNGDLNITLLSNEWALRTGLQTWDTNRKRWKKRKATSPWQSSSAAGLNWHDQKEGRLVIFLHYNPYNCVLGAGHFESHSLFKCSRTRWDGFEYEHSVVSLSFTKTPLLLFSHPCATNHKVSSTKTCHSRWARTLPSYPGGMERSEINRLCLAGITQEEQELTNMAKWVAKATGTIS